jgi:hypothetical protein
MRRPLGSCTLLKRGNVYNKVNNISAKKFFVLKIARKRRRKKNHGLIICVQIEINMGGEQTYHICYQVSNPPM